MEEIDNKYMEMALQLAARGRGNTSPNPLVGAVLVKGGQVVGSGYHQAAGAPHAEVVALQEAGPEAAGCTLYVNLEPCCHHGRTPPCVEAILKAGVQKVVVAMTDPNPQVNGKGVKFLQDRGIEVKTGVLAGEARQLNEVFIKYVTSGEPFVLVKTAMSMDGKIATHTGDTRWITGEKARHWVQRLRSEVDGVVVGIETVLRDDPALTTRLEDDPAARDAARIIVDSKGRLPLDARIINPTSTAPTILAVSDKASRQHILQLRDLGVEVWELPTRQGGICLKSLLKALGEQQFSYLLVEGGGTLNYSFLEENLIDKLCLFVAPMVCGGSKAPTPFGGKGVDRLSEAWGIFQLKVEEFGGDLLLSGYPRKY